MKAALSACGLLFMLFVVVESVPRRYRVKTIANITSTPAPETSTEEIANVTTTVTPRPIIRRQRLRTTSTTTTESAATTSEPTTQRNRRRFRNSTTSTEAPTTTVLPIRQKNRNNSQNGDGQVAAQSAQRVLVKPVRNSTVYNFETGRYVVKENPVKKLEEAQEPVEQVEPDAEEEEEVEETVVTPKRYSSRYSDRQQVEPTTDSAEYQEDSQGAYGEQVVDEESAVDAEAYKEEQKKGGGDVKKVNKGSGEEHHADAHAVKDSKDSKGYHGGHKFHKAEKGHHDKEQHKGEYKDEKGSKKSHKEGGGHFEAGAHGEKGEKTAEHAEKEEFKKGHSTRGGHVVHKKDEYEKKMEFYDESHEDGHGEKFGSYFESHGAKKGGHKKGGHKDGGSEGKHAAKKGHFAKGSQAAEHKGHDKKAGKDGTYGHMEKYAKEASKKDAKKYDYSTNSGKPKKAGDGEKKNLEEHEQLEQADNDNLQEVSETEPVKKIETIQDANVQYMNQDGPTSRLAISPKKLQQVGYFMTEDELLENKEEAESLRVFDPVNHHHENEEVGLNRGYRVAEPETENEPQESHIHVVSLTQPVKITARNRLPPIATETN